MQKQYDARGRLTLALTFNTLADLDHALSQVKPFIAPFENRFRRGGRSISPHRLIELVECVEADRAAGIVHHVSELVELRQVASTLVTWSGQTRHPVAAAMLGEIADPAKYAHHILTLSAARLLHTAKNYGIEFIAPGTTPLCDLRVTQIAPGVGIEVKAPELLQRGAPLTDEAARALAKHALDASSDQRRMEKASLLWVAGNGVPFASLRTLCRAFLYIFETGPVRDALTGAVAMTFGRHPEDVQLLLDPAKDPAPAGGIFAALAARLNPAILQTSPAYFVALNPRYSGPVPVVDSESEQPGLRLPIGPIAKPT